MKLMTLGDSHSLFSFAGVAEAKIYWRGPVTMHRAARDGIASLVPKNCRPTAKDILVLSFGEIDSRTQIPKHALLNARSSLDEAELLCNRFKIALDCFRADYPATVALACIAPFNPDSLEYGLYPDAETCQADAKAIRTFMNERMRNMGVPFVDFHKAFARDDGTIIPEFSDAGVHIDSRHSAPVLEALRLAVGRQFTHRDPPWPPFARAEPPYRPLWKRVGKALEAYARSWLNVIPGFAAVKARMRATRRQCQTIAGSSSKKSATVGCVRSPACTLASSE